MLKRITRLMVVALTVAFGTFVFAGPAHAQGGCTSGLYVTACVNHETDSRDVRADFYLNLPPDDDHYYYRVAIHQLTPAGGDSGQWVTGRTRLTTTGRYCCWTRTFIPNMPKATRGAKTVVYLYTQDGIQHSVYTSPTIWFLI